MSKRGGDFLYHWISDHLPDDPIIDPVLMVIDMAVDAKWAVEAQGIPGREIDEEIGTIYEFIMQGLRWPLPVTRRGIQFSRCGDPFHRRSPCFSRDRRGASGL